MRQQELHKKENMDHECRGGQTYEELKIFTQQLAKKFCACLARLYILALVCGVTGCASAPSHSGIQVETPSQQVDAPELPLKKSSIPKIQAGEKILSTAQARKLLRSTWKNSYTTLLRLAQVEENITGDPLIAGNKVTLLFDGPQTMAAMMAAAKTAKDHINLETYIFDQDEIGMRFADLLIERQRAGIQVQIIYDSIGTLGTPDTFFERMRMAGIRLLEFNPIAPWRAAAPWSPNHRDHRKIMVVDGQIAFTGGVNISSAYANSSLFRSKKHSQATVGWRDTHVQIEGPAVAALQLSFLTTWNSQQAPLLADRDYFPELKIQGEQLVRVLLSEPDSAHDIYNAYLAALNQAQKSIHITCAYFVPTDEIMRVLIAAAKRGVDVKIILPGASDSALVTNASRSYFSTMLAAKIKIFLLNVAVLHAKTAVIDRAWGTVGSTNIDARSLLLNNEVNLMVFSEAFALTLENAFTEDLLSSKEITAAAWADRAFSTRAKEWLARQVAPWL